MNDCFNKPELPERLSNKIELVPFSTCWYWTGTIGSSGYGHAKRQNSRKNEGVHRLAYSAVNGPIPDGLEVDHTCCVRTCINPAHLQLVTHKKNMILGVERRRGK